MAKSWLALEEDRLDDEVTRDVITRRTFHRFVFIAAGLYNLAWGVYSVLDPQWFFRFSGMALSAYPEILACLGMVIALYGILYFQVARDPEQGWLIALVGLTGKILGPVGAMALIWRGQWPLKSIALCAANDFLWWVPFGLYLYDSWRLHRRSSAVTAQETDGGVPDQPTRTGGRRSSLETGKIFRRAR